MFSPGIYWLSQPLIGLGQSSTKNTPYIYIEGEISHDANSQPLQSPAKRTVFLYLSDAAFPYTADKLDALGWNGDFANPALTGEALNGLWVECKHESYDGKIKERFELPGGMEHTAPESDVIRKINAMYRQRKSATRPAPPRSVPAPVGSESAAAPVAGGKIPF